MNWLQRLMSGRYGLDQLNYGLLFLGMGLTLFGRLLKMPALTMLSYVPYLLLLFRMFSRNHNKRRMENNRFFKVWFPVKQWFQRAAQRGREREHFRFYHCPKCHILIKVPKGRGKIKIKCPKCAHSFMKKT